MSVDDLGGLLRHLEELIEEMRDLDEPLRERVFELLGGIDLLHRMALRELGAAVEREGTDLTGLRQAHPAIGWLFDAYAVDIDERAAVDEALERVHPSIRSQVEVLDVTDGVVRLRLEDGTATTAPDRDPRDAIEEALRGSFPGFVSLVIEGADEQQTAATDGGQDLLRIRSEPPEGFTP